MTQTRKPTTTPKKPQTRDPKKPPPFSPSSSSSSSSGMKLIVPLQGVVQGRGGLLLGSLIPCALFYFLQLYLKRRRSNSNPPSSPSSSSSPTLLLPRSSSRSNLSNRGSISRVRVSKLATQLAKPGDDSLYYLGLQRASLDPYDVNNNPDGIIELGVADNKVGPFLLFGFYDVE